MADSAAVAAEIGALLQASAASWNRGDLEGFLDDYSDDPGLTFISDGQVLRGKAALRTRYEESWFSGTTEPDDLAFDEVVVRVIGPGVAVAHGRYTLYQPGFENQPVSARGRFSLVFRLEGDGWRIIHDHTS